MTTLQTLENSLIIYLTSSNKKLRVYDKNMINLTKIGQVIISVLFALVALIIIVVAYIRARPHFINIQAIYLPVMIFTVLISISIIFIYFARIAFKKSYITFKQAFLMIALCFMSLSLLSILKDFPTFNAESIGPTILAILYLLWSLILPDAGGKQREQR
jgi:hypothetical protein